MKTPIPFKQPWWITLVTTLLLSLFLSLSYWQLNRGFEKKSILESLQQNKSVNVLTNTDITHFNGDVSSLDYHPVILKGQFDNEHVFLIDNQKHANQPGYHVMIPFEYANDRFILVNRGFVPKLPSKGVPTLAPISDPVTISGLIKRPKHNWFVFRNLDNHHNKWPKIALEPDLEAFANILDIDLAPVLIQLDETSDYGFITPDNLATRLTPEKHWGYAGQWLCFAIILIGLYFYFGKKNYATKRKN